MRRMPLIVALLLLAAPAFAAGDSDIFKPQWDVQHHVVTPPSPKPQPNVPQAPALKVVGTWNLIINCGFDATETLTITSASVSSVLGWTQNMLGKSRIVGGSYSGRTVVLTELYGSNHTATWTGHLSPGGEVLSGNIEGVDTRDHRCTFKGSML